ncbi:MAG: hypothetical protein ACD_72C00503G0004 [uncultured bacterium]|nr:MAG: hypothetical protein ACD_72C00503G0004 [uncultured bacterium]
MKKFIFGLLLLLNFVLPLCVISNKIDGDLGWHLRFGQTLHSSEPFPYTDTYTYTFYGKPWINHEWAGDWIFWLIYSRLGYWWLNVFTALPIFLAFLIIGKIFYKKITTTYLIWMLIGQWSMLHIYVARLAMFTPLFFALTIYLIEKAKKNSHYLYAIPPIFWLWSILHGSWILGFIIINIYLGCAILQNILPSKWQGYFNESIWNKNFIIKIIATQIGTALLVTLNPYGFGIWKEIISYFGQNYYKMHIGEWIPSYTFPVFWKILIMQTIALFFVVYGFIKKRISFTYLTIFLAFFYTAINYKRQAIFVGILSAAVLSQTTDLAIMQVYKIKLFQNNLTKQITLFFSLAVIILLLINYLGNTHYTTDVWNDNYLISSNSSNYTDFTWVKNNVQPGSKIFNEFSFGAPLNWILPQAFVYFDGRGTATWMYDKDTSMLEHYFEILNKSNGLKELEQNKTDFILLRQITFMPFSKPDTLNAWIFEEKNIIDTYVKKTQLEKDLDISLNWKKVYSDRYTNVWERINHAQ